MTRRRKKTAPGERPVFQVPLHVRKSALRLNMKLIRLAEDKIKENVGDLLRWADIGQRASQAIISLDLASRSENVE